MSCLSISELSPQQLAQLSVERVERLLAERRAVQSMRQLLRVVPFTVRTGSARGPFAPFESFAPAGEGDQLEIRA